MTATLQTVIGVYISVGESVKDVYVRLPVSTKTTTVDVVRALVAKNFGDQNPATFALYEAEYVQNESTMYVATLDHVAKTDDDLMFLKGEQIKLIKKLSEDVWQGECEGIVGTFPAKFVKPADKGKGEEGTRVCLRALKDSEIPLFVQYNWKSTKGSSNNTFVLKERELDRENATKEMFMALSVTKLQGLLKDLDHQEKRAIEEITSKYEKQSAGFKLALQEAQKHAK